MNPFMFILYDIKRLFGRGKTAFIAMFSPVPVILMFALFLAPILTEANGTLLSGAILNEDDSESVDQLLNLILSYEVGKGNVSVYPVKKKETGESLVDEGKVTAFFYIPPDTYINSMKGKKAVMEFYYAPAHSFDALTFYSGIKSSLSVFGQGMGLVSSAIGTAEKLGLSDEEIISIWDDGINDLQNVFVHRGRIIGKNGIFLFGADYHFRFAIALLFAACAYLSSFPIIYLTSLDLSEVFNRRSIPTNKLFTFFIARIISGAILILCSFFIMFPVARILRQIKFHFAISVILGCILTSLTFSALAVLIGSMFKRGQSALWAGLYLGSVSVAGVAFLSDKTDLPEAVSFLIRISPFRASVSIFSNGLFNLVVERFMFDMIILFAAFMIFSVTGFVIYRKRSAV